MIYNTVSERCGRVIGLESLCPGIGVQMRSTAFTQVDMYNDFSMTTSAQVAHPFSDLQMYSSDCKSAAKLLSVMLKTLHELVLQKIVLFGVLF